MGQVSKQGVKAVNRKHKKMGAKAASGAEGQSFVQDGPSSAKRAIPSRKNGG